MAEQVPDHSNDNFNGDRPSREGGYEVVDMYCVKCRRRVPSPSSFRTPESLRRYMATGICQVCQDLDDRKAAREAELFGMMERSTHRHSRRIIWYRHNEKRSPC